MTVSQELALQTENLYSKFANYPLPPKIEGCPHCVGEEDESLLHAKPLPQLTVEDLDKYVFKALTTWGDLAAFKHFLPRILELLYGNQATRFFDPQLIANKLNYAKLTNWPVAEQHAIKDFVMAWWRFELASSNSNSNGARLSEVLAFIGIVEIDLQLYLAQWHNDYLATEPDLLKLASLISYRRDELWQEKGWLQPTQIKQLKKWLVSQLYLVQQLENLFFNYSGSNRSEAALVSEALDYLRLA